MESSTVSTEIPSGVFETKKILLCNMTGFMAKSKTKNIINETYHNYIARPKLDGSKQPQNDNYYL